jgi:hypothetical protein
MAAAGQTTFNNPLAFRQASRTRFSTFPAALGGRRIVVIYCYEPFNNTGGEGLSFPSRELSIFS